MSTTLKGGQKLEVRAAVPEDAEEVLAFIERVSGESNFLTFGPGEFHMTVEQEAEYFRTCQNKPSWTYLLGFIGDDLVATANMATHHRLRLQHRGELGMSVSRAFWGQGIGAAMLDHLVEWARKNPVLSKLDLRVRADNTRAIALYRGRGFVEEGVLRNQFCVEGKLYDFIAMGMDV